MIKRAAAIGMVMGLAFLGACAGKPKEQVSEAESRKCLDCHKDYVGKAGSSTAHEPLKPKHCMWCHRPHGAANVNILHAGGGRDLCIICHKTFAPAASELPVHTFMGKGECLACHDPP